jgi:NAD(P)H-dependent FMN reductase
MSEILILSCTNRLNSNTLKVSRIYRELLIEQGIDAPILDFMDLPRDIAFSEAFGHRTAEFEQLLNLMVIPNRKFIFVMPEYNGSFPGILKVFLDSVPPREWNDKKACMVGVADGRAGNLRGMEHLTGILNYLKMHVYHNKLPISVVNKVFTNEGTFAPEQLQVCRQQLEGFLKF